MNEILEKILELPLVQKLCILAGSVVLIGAVYWYSFFAPLAEEINAVDKKIDGPNGLRVQITQQEGIAQNLDKFLAEVDRLDAELKKALTELPDKKEIDLLLSRVSDKAKDAGLEIRLFRPQAEQKKDFYAAVPVEIEVQGTFHQVTTFFDEVGHLERVVNLDQVRMIEPVVGDESVSLKTGVVATAFRFLDEGERPEAAGEEDTSKKRRRRK